MLIGEHVGTAGSEGSSPSADKVEKETNATLSKGFDPVSHGEQAGLRIDHRYEVHVRKERRLKSIR